MKIAHVVSDFRRASGVSVFVGELAQEQVSLGHDVALLIGRKSEVCYPLPANVSVLYHPDALELNSEFDVVHIHNLWDPWLTRMARCFRKHGVRVVWSPHGTLTLWALKHKWWKKIPGLLLYQYAALRDADAIHVTAGSEVIDVHRLGLKNQLMVVPLGVRMPELNGANTSKASAGSHTLLFISRVQRKKGLPNLLDAWSEIPKSLKVNWKIQIAGPDQENHTEELRSQCVKLGIEKDVDFLGPVYGEEKNQLYHQADVFVLPTHSENFGSVVIEALSAGTPVICTKGAPWQELEEYRCGRWIDIGVEPLVAALQEMMALSDEERCEMGQRGRKLVEERYEWSNVAKQILIAYGNLSQSDKSH